MASRKPRAVHVNRKDLEKSFSKFMVDKDHYRPEGGDEAYEFNIKIQKISIDPLVRKLKSPKEIDEAVQAEFQDELVAFAEDLKNIYPWIKGWAQGGRSGGWLILITNEPVLTDNWELPRTHWHDAGPQEWMPEKALKPALKRLDDLRSIEQLVKEGIKTLKHDLEGQDWWGVDPKDWVPRGKPSMSGPFDFLNFRKGPEKREVIPVVPVDEPRGGALVRDGATDPFEILAPPQGGMVVRAPGAPSVFDMISAAPAAAAPRPARPETAVAPRWNMFEPPAVPARPPGAAPRRISWRLPSAEELAARLDRAGMAQIFSDARVVRNSPYFRHAIRDDGVASQSMTPIAKGDDLGALADFFGVPYEVLDTYEDRGNVRDAIWNELFFPLFETLSEALEIVKPADLPGWFALEWNADTGDWNLYYHEAR